MARSGVTTLTFTARDIIGKALSVCNARDVDQPLDNIDLQEGLDSLNLLVKRFQKDNHLWKKTEGVVFLDVGKTDYLLGPTGDEACNFSDFIETTLSAAEAADQLILSVTSSTGMAIADTIGIMLDSGTRHWTTIDGVASSTAVRITTKLPSAAASGNTVYTYTNLIDRPLSVLDNARYRASPTDSTIPISRWSRKAYFDQPDKESQGTVTQDYFQPTLDNGRYYVWQTASDGDAIVRITYEQPIEVFVATADDPDFPHEWYYALVYSLAEAIGPEYKLPVDRQNRNSQLAAFYLADAKGDDIENTSLDVQVEM